jgi:hypothetical protein
MNINYALNPPDKLADEFGSKMKIERTLHPQKKIEKRGHQTRRRDTSSLARFLGIGGVDEKNDLLREVEELAQEIEDTTTDMETKCCID